MTETAAFRRLHAEVRAIVDRTPVYDIHTHLYDPAFGDLLLWGIDDLLVYHYLVAEGFRYWDMPVGKFWAMPRTRQADLVWETLFLEHSPVSESCRGVLTTLHRLGFDVKKRDLAALRKKFARWTPADYTDKVFEASNVRAFVMTNNPFDDAERPVWEKGFRGDSRIGAALRIDMILMDFPKAAAAMSRRGYRVAAEPTDAVCGEVRRFLADWAERMKALYVMVSLPPDFAFPDSGVRGRLIGKAVLPFCRDQGLPLALMIGVRKLVNPGLRLAGDGVGKGDIRAVENLCAGYPENRFLVTMLARENQHELAVTARKFRNLHVFGCWWFTNIPVLIDEITRMRLELLGLSMTPQHSDSRVLDQLIYKWDHFRSIIARVLAEKYADIAAAGWTLRKGEIERDVKQIFGGAFERFIQKT
ncbi:MAG: glucuronate isomerase [Planctomycetota bacterium]